MREVLDHLSNEELTTEVKKHGSQRRAALALGVSRSTLQSTMHKRGMVTPTPRRRQTDPPNITIESLHQAMEPPNTCKVKVLLESLSAESVAVVESAMNMNPKDFTATQIMDWLKKVGVHVNLLPGTDAINCHRAGRRPCRCKG